MKTEIWNWWRGRAVPLRRHIFVLFCLPFVLFFSLLMWVTEDTATRVSIEGTRTQFEQVGQRTTESLTRLQQPARAWLGAMTLNPLQGFRGGPDGGMARVHMSLMARFPHIASVYFGGEDGEFFRVLSLPTPQAREAVKAPRSALPASFAIQHIKRADLGIPESWTFFGTQMQTLASESRPNSGFDPRKRTWYERASGVPVGEVVPTEPYVFAFPRQLGVTMSANLGHAGANPTTPAINATTDPASAGVQRSTIGGVDFTLVGLSSYLAQQRGATAVEAFVFDESGMLWAWSKADAFAKLSGSEKAPRVADLPDASLRELNTFAKQWVDKPGSGYFELQAAGGSAYVASVSAVRELGRANGAVYVAVVDRHEHVYASVRQLRWRMLAIGIAGLIGGSLLIAWLSGRLALPLRRLAVQTKLLERFRFNEMKHIPSHVAEVRQLQASTVLARTALAGYARFVPKPLVQHYLALRREPKPGVESRDVVALHALFAGQLQMQNGQNAAAFSAFAQLAKAVEATRGIVDGIDNDGASAIWNAPLIQSNPSLRACEAAIRVIEQLDAERDHDDVPWPLNIAIDSGVAAVGNFGTQDGRLIYTAVGPPIERAKGLAHEARGLSVPLVVTGPVADAIKQRFTLERIAVVQLGMRDSGIDLWRVTGRVAGIAATDWAGKSSNDGWGEASAESEIDQRTRGRSRKRSPRSLNSVADWSGLSMPAPSLDASGGNGAKDLT